MNKPVQYQVLQILNKYQKLMDPKLPESLDPTGQYNVRPMLTPKNKKIRLMGGDERYMTSSGFPTSQLTPRYNSLNMS
jgi:hypothetical protein